MRVACLATGAMLIASLPLTAAVPVDTTFTYQGELLQNGTPMNGTADMKFRLYAQFDGDPMLAELIAEDVPFDLNGRFTIDLDFGRDVNGVAIFNGEARWLEIEVNGETLHPRQPLHATPFAIYALNGGGGGGVGGWIDKGPVTHIMDDVGIGTTNPLADLHVAGDNATLRLEDTTTPGGYTTIEDPQPTQLRINKINTDGLVLFDFNPTPADGISSAYARFFRQTNTTGPKLVHFFRGNNTTQTSAQIGVDGANSFFQMHGGNLGIGTSDPQHPLHVNGIFRVGGSTTGLGGVDGDYLFIQPNSTGLATFRFDQANLRFQNSNWGEIMRLNRDGEVGIGTTNPGARLDVTRTDNGTIMRVGGNGTNTGINISNANIGVQVNSLSSTGIALSVPSISGSARAASFYGNSSSPMLTSWNDGTGLALQVRGPNDASLAGGGLFVSGDVASLNIVMDNNEIMARNNGAATPLYLNAEGGNVVVGSASGGTSRIITPVIQITGGSDLSEQFDVASLGDIEPTPGMVVCIDPRNPGKLMPSTRAYDRTVAGVISGANGVNTGLLMGQSDTVADGAHAVALTGRVYVMTDAGDEAIEPGDLLTTSNVAGHAMRVSNHDAAQGAILGKAMTRLEAGERGMVLVLVSLQ